ncbi:MAG: hypothetical protein M3460_23830 [Actinomycetota bacterium]|nr:hypothetical protein [Actinomycetota bacterium]
MRKFARFFKTYGFSLGLVVAALPFGLQWTNFLGYYHSNGSYLTFVASLVSFLCVAAVFGARQHIGHIVFPARRTLTPKEISARKIYSTIIPTICGMLAIVFIIFYTLTFNGSVDDVAMNSSYLPDRQKTSIHEDLLKQGKAQTQGITDFVGRSEGQLLGKPGDDYRVVGRSEYNIHKEPIVEHATRLSKPAYDAILAETAPGQVSYQFFLFTFYVLAFVMASVSLVWFGAIEYLQAELGITDADLIRRPYRVSDPKTQTDPLGRIMLRS